MKSNNIKDVDGDLTILFKVVDKLEKRIATLEDQIFIMAMETFVL
jgi:hypothetical protein